MFFNTLGKPTRLKRAVYLSASVVLGLLLSFIAHALIEINYLHQLASQGQVARFYGGCALPSVFQIALLLLGVIGGYFLGRFWWQKVYVERACEKKRP